MADRSTAREIILQILSNVDPMEIATEDNPFSDDEYAEEAGIIEKRLFRLANIGEADVKRVVAEVAAEQFDSSLSPAWEVVASRVYLSLQDSGGADRQSV